MTKINQQMLTAYREGQAAGDAVAQTGYLDPCPYLRTSDCWMAWRLGEAHYRVADVREIRPGRGQRIWCNGERYRVDSRGIVELD